uniref:Uncharacterized protein n=1 Tax=Ixodes ricinus TaxID=34613 RepID=A0A6B0UXW5_IXORI
MRSKRSLRAACVYTAPSISTSSAQLDTCFTRPGTRTRMVPQTTSYHPTARRYSLGSIVMPRRRDPGNTLAYWMKFRRFCVLRAAASKPISSTSPLSTPPHTSSQHADMQGRQAPSEDRGLPKITYDFPVHVPVDVRRHFHGPDEYEKQSQKHRQCG